MAAFVYSPLDLEHNDNFRLLDLLPGDGGEQIQCTLTHRRAPCRAYEAISYTWGTREPNRPILMNGLVFQVTENLEAALRYLRYPGRSRTLWADAICINQSDVEERNHQVQQMGDVYSNALTTLVWLGEASSDSDLGIALIQDLCHCLAEQGVTYADTEDVTVHSGQDLMPKIEGFLEPAYYEHWQGLSRVLIRPWWQRAWIVQELASAARAVFHCGTRSVEWHQLELIIWIFVASAFYRSSTILGFKNSNRIYQLVRVRRYFRTTGASTLFALYSVASCQDCQDPRDKVYSILALTDANTRAIVQVDYSRSVAWAYILATKADIARHGDLAILSCLDTGTEMPGCPSWVVNWSLRPTMFRLSTQEVTFAASKSKQVVSTSFSEDLQTLYCDGFCTGIVEDCNVSEVEECFSGPEDRDVNSWNIEAMITRLINSGGVMAWDKLHAIQQAGHSRRSVQRSIYDILIIGQIGGIRGWEPYEVTFASEVEIADEEPERLEHMMEDVEYKTRGRTVIVSDSRFLALAPKTTRAGDRIFILFGLEVPLILRPQGDGTHTVVGVGYVHSVMYGESLSGLENGTFRNESVVLR